MKLPLWRVRFDRPNRTFYVRALDGDAAARIAKHIEIVLEHDYRCRSIEDAVVEAVTGETAEPEELP